MLLTCFDVLCAIIRVKARSLDFSSDSFTFLQKLRLFATYAKLVKLNSLQNFVDQPELLTLIMCAGHTTQ